MKGILRCCALDVQDDKSFHSGVRISICTYAEHFGSVHFDRFQNHHFYKEEEK